MIIYRDPNASEPAGAPVTPPVVEVPKTKEDWNKLSKEDPARFAELTQTKIDTIFRQNKELQEKLQKEQEEKENFRLELQKFNQPPEPIIPPEKYARGRYPQTKDDWNDLFIEDPVLANDLRNQYFQEQQSFQNEFSTARTKAVEVLTSEHADMYKPALDETGKPKLDSQGKVIIAVDPNTGGPAFNSESEKGKLWTKIFEDAWVKSADGSRYNPYMHMKDAPLVMMAEMERQLRTKGANMVKGSVPETDQSGMAPPGVPPPKTGPVKWKDEEERVHVERQVARGVYRNVEDYIKHRDRGEYGYVEENRRPDFSKK